MRGFLAAAAAFALALQTAPASAAVVWQGDAMITSVTAGCTSATSERWTIGVGTVLRSIFRPARVSNNGNDSRFTFTHDSQANFAIFLPGGGTPEGNYTSYGVKHNGVIVANQGGAYRRFQSVQTSIGETTPFIEYIGTIDNFMFVPGCTVNFRAAYVLRD